MGTMRMQSVLAALLLAANATGAAAFTMADQMAATGIQQGTASTGASSAAPIINNVRKSLGKGSQVGKSSRKVKRDTPPPKNRGRGLKAVAQSGSKLRASSSGWGGGTQGWAKQGSTGAWTGGAEGWARANTNSWSGAGSTWSAGGQGVGWARPGGPS